jgi:hypothetical protein
MNVRNPDITGPRHHLKTGARIRAQHEHIKNITTHPALTGEGGCLKIFYTKLWLYTWVVTTPSMELSRTEPSKYISTSFGPLTFGYAVNVI